MRLILICHGATAATRTASFPADEPLEEAALRRARRLGKSLPAADRSWTSPSLRARQTAEALSLEATPHPALRECDYGRWAGRTLDDLGATEPEALGAWLSDFAAAPHGGEPLADLFERVSGWIDDVLSGHGRAIAVTHPTVIRAAVVHVLGAPRSSFWRLDVEPLGVVELSAERQRPRLRLGRAGRFSS
jgi:broad specificity phosphatase PhoE